MKRILFVLGVASAVLLSACANPSPPRGEGSESPTPDNSPRVAIYEAVIRHLANPEGPQPVFIVSHLCFQLMEGTVRCPGRLSDEEQQQLEARLGDLGAIVFLGGNDDQRPSPDDVFQEIVLGPIVETPDGLRVEGGSVCGGLCGSGAVYVLEANGEGYEVTGTDDTYGSWVA